MPRWRKSRHDGLFSPFGLQVAGVAPLEMVLVRLLLIENVGYFDGVVYQPFVVAFA